MVAEKQIQCPYCQNKITKGKHLKGDLIQHLWGNHKLEIIFAHKAAEYFITMGKPLPLATKNSEADLSSLY